MSDPLQQDQRVIADTSIDGIYQDGTAYVIPIVIGEEGKDFWRYPLLPEVLNRLARVAYANHHNFDKWNESPNLHAHWEQVIREVFAELMGQP